MFSGEYRRLRAIGRDPQRRVWLLQRLGHNRGLGHVKILALKPTGLLSPRLLDNRQRFLKTFAALLSRHIKPLKVDGDHAAAHPELYSPLAENIDDRRFFGCTQGMLQGEQHHRGSQANARGSLRQGRSQD